MVLRKILRLLRVLSLRLKGVKASWSARISWHSEITRMGGVIEIGRKTTIDKGVILRAYKGSIKIGSHSSVNPYSVLYGHGGLKIGNGVRIATHSVFIPANHNFADTNLFIYQQGETRLGITVEDDVWLGSGVRILDGVKISKGCVVGAGSVVTKNLAPYGVYVGAPAKLIRQRGS